MQPSTDCAVVQLAIKADSIFVRAEDLAVQTTATNSARPVYQYGGRHPQMFQAQPNTEKNLLFDVIRTCSRLACQTSEHELEQEGLIPAMLGLADFATRLRRGQNKQNSHLLEQMMMAIAEGVADFPHLHAEAFHALYTLIGVTPENEGREITELACAFHANGLSIGRQTMSEMKFMSSQYKSDSLKSVAGKASEHLQAAIDCFKNLAEHKRSKATKYLVDILDPNQGQGLEIPRYVNELWYFAVGDESAESLHLAAEAEHDSSIETQCLLSSSYDVPQAPTNRLRQLRQDNKPSFFQTPEGSARKDSGSIPALQHFIAGHLSTSPSCGKGRECLVSARSLFEVESHPGFGILRVKPGLQPLLRRPTPDRADALGVFCLSSLREEDDHHNQAHQQRDASEGKDDSDLSIHTIEAVFSNNAEAWAYINKETPP